MIRIVIEIAKLNDSGKTAVWYDDTNAPTNPEQLAPRANASSFVLTVLMPIASAAVSSSRIAIHARPSRLSRKRRHRKNTTTRMSRIRYRLACGLELLKTISLPNGLGKVGGSIGLIPSTPPVKLKFGPMIVFPAMLMLTLSRFLNSRGTISPKPRVTIAR